MDSYTFGREAFVAAEAEVHLCFVAEAECGPKPHFEGHSAPEPKPNFGRSLQQLDDSNAMGAIAYGHRRRGIVTPAMFSPQ